MSDPVIRVEGLGKRYALDHMVRSDTLRDTLVTGARRYLRRFLGRDARIATEEFWALRDIGFDVRQGEVLGVVGRNGAGKSTLLKLLSRITEPTTGRIKVRGRIASLLEVGTGFHPELTGRDNIYLNGAILGMSRVEIARKFDEIVAFAEVERFLDTPVKHYSSGMYVRLAFAVAAHLEPEILIIDEVLAVGDAAFQRKCLGKMGEVAGSGRTVLFVSHNMPAVLGLCSRAILLENSRLVLDGPVADIVSRYCQQTGSATGRYVAPADGARKPVGIRCVEILGESGQPAPTVDNGRPLCIRVEYRREAAMVDELVPSVEFHTATGTKVFTHHSMLKDVAFRSLPLQGHLTFRLPRLPLPGGTYYVSVYLVAAGRIADQVENALEVHVVDGSFYPRPGAPGVYGLTLVEGDWTATPSP